jgi:hypothetical protein
MKMETENRMNKRLKSAAEGICEGAVQMPMKFEMKGGGLAVFMPVSVLSAGHGKFPADVEFELTILDAMGDVVSTQTRTYR